MHVDLVYNPHAGHNRAGKMLPDVEAYLNSLNITFDLHLTDYPEHAVQIVRDLNVKNSRGIIAAGGDGTLFEVVNGYFQNPARKKPPLGILPVGTGNAFARDLDLHVDRWKDAVEIIKMNRPRKVDVGHFRTHGQDYYYLNILGMGFVADVTRTASGLKLLGNISYTLGVFYQTLLLKTHNLTMLADGKRIEKRNVFVEISNTRYTANFLMAPNAEIDDGFLDVTLLGKVSRRRLLSCFPKIFTGDHIHMEEVDHFKAKHLSIVTDKPKVLSPDGELTGITPVEIKCLHRAIEVFWK